MTKVIYTTTPWPGRGPWHAAIDRAITDLESAGHQVEEQDIPGLWRINGGPEITSGQLLSIAAANAVRPAP